jgi:DNA-binding XRE family transcriptional regulator
MKPFGTMYEITEDGRVWSHYRDRFLRPGMGTNGRPFVNIYGKLHYIHVMICTTYHGPRPEGMVASHIDGDKLNNHKDNLRWETQSQNMFRKRDHGTDDRGVKNSRAVLTPETVQKVHHLRKSGWTHLAIAQELGVSRTTISRVLNKHRYTEVM